MKIKKTVLIVIFSLISFTACDNSSTKTAGIAGAQSSKLTVLPIDMEPGEIIFSPDGREVAVASAKGTISTVSANGSQVASFQGVRDLVYGGKGKSSLVFIAKENGRECVVVNGVKGRWFDSIGKCVVMDDGLVLYAARSADRWVIVSGARESAPFYSNNANLVVFDSAGRLVYTELDSSNSKSHLRICSIGLDRCVNGEDYEAISGMLADSTGSRLAFLASRNNKTALVTVDMKKQAPVENIGDWHDEVSVFDLSEGGIHSAYLARNGRRHFLVKDGKYQAVPSAGIPLQLVVSRAGRVCYIGVIGNDVLFYLDGKQAGDKFQGIDSLSFSPDGLHYVFIGNYQNHDRLFVDGIGLSRFDKIVDARFSPDGKNLVFRARQNNKRFMVVADEAGNNAVEHQHYDAVWGGVFLPDGKSIGYGVRTGSDLWWKVEKLKR